MDTIDRLRAAAAKVKTGHVPTQWRRVHGPGPADVRMRVGSFIYHPMGSFENLGLEPGEPTAVSTRLELPPVLHGVRTAGEQIELTVHGIYPTVLSYDGKRVVEDDDPDVACGPALVALDRLFDPERPGELVVEVRPPNNQLTAGWCHLHVTTPGLRRRFRCLDVARAQLSLALALAADATERAAVEAAARLVPDALDTIDTAELEEALAGIESALGDLASRAGGLSVHVVGHSHIDLSWWWTWDDTQRVILRDVATVLDLMDEYPELTFVHSQAASYEVLRSQRPDLFDRIRAYIGTGRWEPAVMQWVESDLNMVAAEAQARQILEGVHYARTALGTAPTAFMAPDTFGHPGNIPQLAASAGARVYYHHRGNPGEPTWPAYWWEGIDGSEVLACSTMVYSDVEVTAGALADVAIESLERGGLPVSLHMFGVGDHGGGPTRLSLETMRDLRGRAGLPTIEPSSLARYADAVVASGVPLPRGVGDTSTIWEGCYTSHADGKRWNRDSENRLVSAEALAVVAGLDRSSDLTPAWHRVLFNQFHDIICGTSIAEVYDAQGRDAAAVAATAERVTNEALDRLETGLAPGTLAVTNPLAVERTDLVLVPTVRGPAGAAVALRGADGSLVAGQHTDDGLAFVATVGPFGTAAFTIDETAPVPDAMEVRTRDAGFVFLGVGTPTFDAEVRTDCGVITSLVDRRVGRQLVAFGRRKSSDYTDASRPDLGLNVLQLVEQRPGGMSAWQLHEVYRETSHITGGETTVVEQGPIRVVLRHTATFGASTVDERITFHRELPRVDLDLRVDWQELGGRDIGVPQLKLAFTPDLDSPTAWFETPFGAVRRRTNGQEVPALRWADLVEPGEGGYGVALVNGSTYGYDALGCRLRATIVRTAFDPDTRSDAGPQRATFSLIPHQGDWHEAGIPAAAAGWNQPLIARVVAERRSAEQGTALRPRLEGETTAWITGVKRAHDGAGVVVRVAENAGRATTARLRGLPDGSRVWQANIVEDRGEQLPSAAGGVDVALTPWQVATLVVELA